MKKMILALLVLAMAGIASADLVDGGFATTGTTGDTLLKVTDNTNLGWFTGSTGGALADGSVGNYLRPDLAANYLYAFGQIWTDTLTGTQNLKFDFSNVDIADLTGAVLHIGIYDLPATGQIRTGFPANDVTTSTIGEWYIDQATIAAGGAYTSADLDFTGTTGTYAIRMSFEATGDAGDADGFSIDNVSIIPEPATFGLVGLGALVALFIRRSQV